EANHYAPWNVRGAIRRAFPSISDIERGLSNGTKVSNPTSFSFFPRFGVTYLKNLLQWRIVGVANRVYPFRDPVCPRRRYVTTQSSCRLDGLSNIHHESIARVAQGIDVNRATHFCSISRFRAASSSRRTISASGAPVAAFLASSHAFISGLSVTM